MDKRKILENFSKEVSKQTDCPKEFIDIVEKEFWNLIDIEEDSPESVPASPECSCSVGGSNDG